MKSLHFMDASQKIVHPYKTILVQYFVFIRVQGRNVSFYVRQMHTLLISISNVKRINNK